MRTSKLLALAATALACVGIGLWILAIPPRAETIPGGRLRSESGTFRARGVIHVHTRRSDGSGSIDDVARAAARSGLDFVILTDHGDGTQPPARSQYRAGVLCLDAVEISTTGGHVLGIGLPATPFPLAGEPSAVVDDVHRFGGLAIAAHPDSPKPALAWTDWNAPVDGFEWLNVDSEWRDESRLGLLRAFSTFWWRGPESIASLFARNDRTLSRWDQWSASGRPVNAVAGADAHARLGWSDDRLDGGWTSELEIPSYEDLLKVLSVSVELDRPLSGRAQDDAEQILSGLSAGRTYTTIDALARGGALDFFGDAAGRRVRMGERLRGTPLSKLSVRARAPVGASLRLLRNGTVIADSSGVRLDLPASALQTQGPTAFRVEVVLGGRGRTRVPWLISNAIWVDLPDAPRASVEGGGEPPLFRAEPQPWSFPLHQGLSAGAFAVERDPQSSASLRAEGGEAAPSIAMPFLLGPRVDGWIAAAVALGSEARTRLTPGALLRLRLEAPAPMRISVQLRAPSASEDLRWGRSVFLEGGANTLDIPLGELMPLNRAAADERREASTTLLLVIDRTNTSANTAGRLRFAEVTIGVLR